MSAGFAADWLALREAYDARAVDPGLRDRLRAWAAGRDGLRVLDLGAGTGALARRLAPHLAGGVQWTLVENDPALIDAGRPLLPPLARYHPLDLQEGLETLADMAADLIAASALIDLVSAAWLRRLAALRAGLDCALYVTLSYDGRIAWRPALPLDPLIRDAVNRHQRTDKGFGPALGPAAAHTLAGLLPGAVLARSDWRLGPEDRRMQAALLEGHAMAAAAVEPGWAAEIGAWAQRRRERIEAGGSSLAVGHLDLLYLPTG